MKGIYIFVLLFYVYDVICSTIRPVAVVEDVGEDAAPMDAILYKTIHKYYCSVENMTGINLIMYGTNSWIFPEQDVNLTLSYPHANGHASRDMADIIITGFTVVLYMDGTGSNGFIVSGGILQESITLTFTSSQVTKLRYRFWVFGRRKSMEPRIEQDLHMFIVMCH